MASTPPKTDIEPPSVSVFVRPLEVSVPVLDSPPLPPSNPPPPKTYVSTMTSRIETETSIKRWSTPQVKHEEGQPPGPEDHPETREGKKLEGNVKTITPSYKLGEDKPVHDIRLGTAGYLPSGTGDYKVSMRQEDYKQTVIDPKVRSNANMPLSSMKLPDARRALADDFPSEHSKRSQIKLEPLEQRRFKSVERRPVSTSSYLTESVNRHRDADKSILHPYLKAKEGDASKPWEKPNWPGPKKNADDEKMRELEIMKQKLETISKQPVNGKAKASSMYNLSILSPDEFGKTIVVGQPSPTLHDIGTLIKMRKERLEHSKQMRKTKSEDMLVQLPPKEDWSHSDLAHRQLRKEFHLSQYTERRSSWSQEVRPGPSKPEEQPQSVHLPVQVSVKVDEDKRKPRGPEEDYPERLMSPPPTKEPRSILKSERSQQRYDYRYSSDQQYQHQHYEEYREVRNGTRAPSERVEPPPPPPPPAAIQSHPPHHHHGPSKPTTAPPPPPAQPMRPRSTTFQDLPEEERYRIMQENLMKHRQHRPTTPKQHTANFNGPFFRLEEVTPGASGQPYRPPTTNGYSLNQMKSMSQSEMELEQHFHRNEEPHVVVWPPPNDKNRPRSQSVMSKSMMDPERIEELRRQQALEREAMKRHDDEKMKSMAKQIRAMQIQQERLYEQQHGVTSPVPMMPMGHEDPNAYMTDMDEEAPGPQPQNMRIFETRPISSMSENVDMPTWKRTYVVDRPQEVAKNEILTSDELLQREQYEVDILKRREAFVEKPDMAPELQRTGKRWQPPPDKPYVWPTLRRPISVEPHLTSPIDFPPGPPQEEDEYKWAPVVNDPGYRRERKNFTPTHSPPPSPRRGMNTLDEVNKRQTKYVVQPSSDGSHRPKPAFRKERHPPHGGFYPHAPNAIKVVKRRAASVQNLNSPNMEHEDIEVIAHRNYLRVDPVYQQHPPSRSASAVDHRLRRDSSHHSSHHELSGINEWEKIYELPPHSSTIVGKDVPRNIDVRRRLNQFEGSIQNLAERKHLVRATSVESAAKEPPKDDKPRSIMKRRELESREQMMYPANQQLVQSYQRSSSNVAKPTVTETVQRFEETRRTEEVERRVQRKERRERRSRHHSSSRHGGGWGHDAYIQEQRRMASLPRQIVYQQANRAMTADETDQLVREAYEAADDARRHGTRVRSNSLSRALPNTQEAYYRQTTTKRDRDFSGSRYEDEAFGRGLAHARYGSLSDSLRRGELKYIPNGDVRESGHFGNSRNVHKSYSTRDVFNNDYDRRSVSSQRRGSQQVSPFVEFPPTLPRRGDRDNYRPISKSRSYADWDDQGRAGFGGAVRRYDDDMTRLEAEFRDSLLMPMPRGNMNERDHRTENIPGGYETFDKNKKAQTGRRLGREGQPVDYHESSQEYNYKREQELDRRR